MALIPLDDADEMVQDSGLEPLASAFVEPRSSPDELILQAFGSRWQARTAVPRVETVILSSWTNRPIIHDLVPSDDFYTKPRDYLDHLEAIVLSPWMVRPRFILKCNPGIGGRESTSIGSL
jgi:hypothetical protein